MTLKTVKTQTLIEQQPFFGVKSSGSGASVRTSRDLFGEMMTGGMSDAGEAVTHHRAARHATVFQCVRVLSESIGSLPVSLYRRQGETRQRLSSSDNAIARIIGEQPNSFQTAAEFWEMAVAHLGFRGNFYAFQVRSSTGKLGELIPFHPDAVSVKQNDDYSIDYTVVFQNGTQRVINEKEMFHLKLFSFDGVLGVNPIEYARNTIGLSMALERHGARLFKNGGRPSGLLSTETRLNPDDMTNYRTKWEEAHGGENSGGTAVLGNGLKYQTIALNAVDSQWLENRKFQKADIAAFYRVPLHKINDLEKSSFSNIEHQSLEYVRDSLMPYAVKIEQRIRTSLMTEAERASGLFAKFNFNGLLRGDMPARAAFYNSMVMIGAMSPNEVRSLEDQNPRDGGDIYLTPLNMAINGKPMESGT